MGRLLFGADGGGDGGGVEPSDWDPVATHDEDGKAPSLDRLGSGKSDGIVLTVKKKKTRTPEGVHRDFNTVTNYGGDPLKVAVGMGEHSESAHEYMYAPGLSPLAAILFTGARFGSGARKFWIDPQGRFLEFDGLDEHDQVLLDSSVAFAGLTGSEAIEDAMAQGWVRGGIEGSEMYLQFDGDVSKVPAALKAIPQELLFVSNLTVQLGVPVSEFIAIPVDEGEDAADAWAKRKSPRKRVRGELAQSYVGHLRAEFGGYNKYADQVDSGHRFWIRPDGSLLDVDALGHSYHRDALYAELPKLVLKICRELGLKPQEAMENGDGDLDQDLMDQAMSLGWIRGWQLEDRSALILEGENVNFDKALASISSGNPELLFVKELWANDQAVPVDEGEDAQTAWQNRNHPRKRVAAELAQSYQDNLSNVMPQDPSGYPDRIEDSNNTPRRPGRRGDKNVQLDRLPGDKSYPSGSPEPPNAADIGMGNMLYPLAGVEAPPSGFISGAGFISPDGTPYSMSEEDERGATDETHGEWILRNLAWLRSRGYLSSEDEDVLRQDLDNDALRDILVEVDNWIHVFNCDTISVKRLDHATEARIRKVYLEQDVDKPADGLIKVWDHTSGKTVELDLNEENPMLGALRGILFIQADEKTVDFTDPESGLNFKYIWDSEVNRLPSHVQIVMEDPSEPEGKRHLPTLEIELGPQGWEVPQGGTSAQMGAVDIAMANLPQVLKNVADRVAKKFQVQEKDDGQKPSRYNVLEDPALEAVTGLTPEEKIFTTITDWDGDSFYVDLSRVDPATMKILKQHPQSDPKRNKYFSWDLVSKSDKAELAKKDVKTRGNTALDLDQDSLIVERLPAWKQIEPQVQKARKENQAS